MTPSLNERLRGHYVEALAKPVNEKLDGISSEVISCAYPETRDWVVGPYAKMERMTFRKTASWDDPCGIGWDWNACFNASLIEHDGCLRMFYRAAPRKESLCSRIGSACWDGARWVDSPVNPVIHPTMDCEELSCEDPRLYRKDGQFFLYYNGIWPMEGPEFRVGCDTLLAVSHDLIHWEKRGLVVPREVSRGWSKGPVIPRDPMGEPVRINGEYLMFISEGCGGNQYLGHSDDLLHWRFEPWTFLPLPAEMGSLHEVACALHGHEPSGRVLILDFFYSRPDGTNAGAQARYDIGCLAAPKGVNRGASLSWGGMTAWDGRLTIAQGWDAPRGQAELYLYSAEFPLLATQINA